MHRIVFCCIALTLLGTVRGQQNPLVINELDKITNSLLR